MTIVMAVEAIRAVTILEPMTAVCMEPLTSTASRNRFPVGSTNFDRKHVKIIRTREHDKNEMSKMMTLTIAER